MTGYLGETTSADENTTSLLHRKVSLVTEDQRAAHQPVEHPSHGPFSLWQSVGHILPFLAGLYEVRQSACSSVQFPNSPSVRRAA